MVNRMRLVNQLPSLLLRSPLHRVISGGVLLLTFTGRASGQQYTTPINYLRAGDTVMMTTDSPWWKNLRGGAPAALRLRGHSVTGIANVVTDEAAIAEAITAMMARFSRYGRFANVRRGPNGEPNREDLVRAVRAGRVLIRVRLVAPPTPAVA